MGLRAALVSLLAPFAKPFNNQILAVDVLLPGGMGCRWAPNASSASPAIGVIRCCRDC
jgi:hypothetical protein